MTSGIKCCRTQPTQGKNGNKPVALDLWSVQMHTTSKAQHGHFCSELPHLSTYAPHYLCLDMHLTKSSQPCSFIRVCAVVGLQAYLATTGTSFHCYCVCVVCVCVCVCTCMWVRMYVYVRIVFLFLLLCVSDYMYTCTYMYMCSVCVSWSP